MVDYGLARYAGEGLETLTLKVLRVRAGGENPESGFCGSPISKTGPRHWEI